MTKQRRRLAAELRRLRREAHVSDDELRNAGIHPATWYRIVRGQTRKPQRRTVETLLDLFGVYGRRREELLAMASGDGAPDWLDAYDGAISDAYAEYIIVEANARCISNAETSLIPGLVQIPEYTAALVRALPGTTDTDVAREVEVRARRQEVLRTATLHVVLDEAVLWRPVGGADVMRQQLAHLATVADRDNVTVQVLPFSSGAHPAGTGSFVIMKLPDGERVTFVESMAGLAHVSTEGEPFYRHVWDTLVRQAHNPSDSKALLLRVADAIPDPTAGMRN